MNPFETTKAALKEKGHIKNDFWNDKGYCLMGAYNSSVVKDENEDAWEHAERRIRDIGILGGVCQEQFPDRMPSKAYEHSPGGWMIAFNDHPETTVEDVFTVLDKAAVKWEEAA